MTSIPFFTSSTKHGCKLLKNPKVNFPSEYLTQSFSIPNQIQKGFSFSFVEFNCNVNVAFSVLLPSYERPKNGKKNNIVFSANLPYLFLNPFFLITSGNFQFESP